MKHLIAMLFYNIVIGSTVMFKKEYEEYERENFCDSILSKHIWTYKKYKVIGMYSTFFTLTKTKDFSITPKLRSDDFFQIMVAIENSNGNIQYVGIKALKELTI